MEGLAAVGAASSIVQLVDFSLKLMATGKEIRDSLSGSSLQNEALENVYQQMHSILQPVGGLAASKTSQPVQPECDQILLAARIAHKDCSEILSLLRQLKLNSGGHKRWGSVVTAFKSIMGQKKILEVETRLRMELASVSIELSRLIWKEVQKLNASVNELIHKASRDGIQNDPQLEQLSESFAGLCKESRNAAVGPTPCGTRTLVKAVENLCERAEKYDSVKKITNTKQAVINSLHFAGRARRHEAIPENHKATFGWIYSIPSFQQWMEDGGGIFWIHGKPGSGKSTLMKFLADNPRTQAHLDKWAHPYRATIAAHYFWNLGTNMQKSLLGLMRTLVFEILRKSPDSIQSACPTRWQMALEDQFVFINQKKYDREGQWTMEELSETIERLAQSEEGRIQARLCLFVDGLDEFEGDHRQVCKLLTSLARLPHIKVCLSSRPMNVFRDELGCDETRQLAVHQLTGPDMEQFVNDHLVSHRNWGGGLGNCMITTEEKTSLVNEIRERANGVFLWVALVTKSICDGLTNQDSIHDLRERLRLLPTDLVDLFKHILDRIDPAYSKKSAECLWIALHDQSKGLPAEAYYFHERDHENDNYAVEWPVRSSNVDVQESASRRITALTGGLLEVTSDSECRIVSFLHRTVSEFLLTRDISRDIMTRMRPNFDVHLALAKITTVLCKRRYLTQRNLEMAVTVYLPRADRPNFASTMDLLDALELTASQTNLGLDKFKETVVRSPLFEQVSRKLSINKAYFSDLRTPPAVLLLQGDTLKDESVEMLRVLGRHGDYLNRPTPDTSPWVLYFRTFTIKRLNDYVQYFRKLVAIGADPNAQVRYNWCTQSVFSVYLILSFSYYARDVNLDAYLDTLDVFLDHGADFWQPITFETSRGPVDERFWWPARIDSRYNTVEKTLSRGLKLLGSDTQMMPSRTIVFQTVKRILTKRAADVALMSHLRIPITQAFPEHMSSALLGMMPRARSRRRPLARKRDEDELSDMERPARSGTKRARVKPGHLGSA